MENLIFLICSFWLSLFIMLAVVLFRISKILSMFSSFLGYEKKMSSLFERLIDFLEKSYKL